MEIILLVNGVSASGFLIFDLGGTANICLSISSLSVCSTMELPEVV